MGIYGKAVAAAFVGCDFNLSNNPTFLLQNLGDACHEAGATVLWSKSHAFEPQGASALVLLAESHAGAHTWPENGVATCVVFTCGDRVRLNDIIKMLATALRARSHATSEVDMTELVGKASANTPDT